ncbi:RING finger protein 126-B [Talaromyces islandicus]|uniref:RING finger protein 126-B n=1 Tax=Talaromyces islandicus TaxID=28573 RepID=A0A0U1M767_TALIS|nr:RING finger protein 126-B [Talaromyces islandicus]
MIMMPFPHITGLLLLLLALLVQRGSSVSVTISPSNDSLPDAKGTFLLANSRHPYSTPINLAPLTSDLAGLNLGNFRFSCSALFYTLYTSVAADIRACRQSFHCEGSLVLTTSSNAASITNRDIALISCDPSAYQGYINASETLSSVISLANGGPAAVVLYSSEDDHCLYQALDQNLDYSNVFTILQSFVADTVVDQLHADSTNTSNTITANMATSGGVGFGNSSSDSGDSGGSSSSGLAVSTPTTAVAMIILYTITGIITALFLGIIITGAVRAHRHPERYGPRNVVGRPRQSRARGIARAMLETIPIVKFGDSDTSQLAAAKRDIEMASRSDEDGATTMPIATPTHHDSVSDHAAPEVQSTDTPATTGEPHDAAPTAAATDGGNRVCPICTDEFVKGQDMRVLPCNHQFHPDCIDPWLINVSGTCPLCRIDLNPADESAEQTEQHQQQTSAEQTPAEPAVEESAPASHRRLTGYLSDIRRARNAPVEERIAALRQLRQNEQQQGASNASEDLTDEAQGRRRLTMRLRDRFRIRTRRHE